MKHTQTILVILFFNTFLFGCKSEEQKTAEPIAEHFMKLYMETGLYLLKNNHYGYNSENSLFSEFPTLHIQKMYPFIHSYRINLFKPHTYAGEKRPYYIPISKFELIESTENDSSIIVSFNIEPADKSSNKNVDIYFNKDSLKLIREKTKIQDTKGLLNYENNMCITSYPELFINIAENTDSENDNKIREISEKQISNRKFFIDNGTITSKNHMYIQGYSIISNYTESTLKDVHLLIKYSEKEMIIEEEDIFEINIINIDEIGKGDIRIPWTIYNNHKANSINITLDYNYGPLKDLVISKTRKQMGLE